MSPRPVLTAALTAAGLMLLAACAGAGTPPIGAGGNAAAPAGGQGGGTASAAPYRPFDISPMLQPKKKYVGVALPGDVPRTLSPLDAYARLSGKEPDLAEYYLAWGDDFQGDQAQALWEHGQLSYVAWEPQTASLAKIASGAEDDYIRRTATAIRDANVPVALSFAHEMNGGWYPWGTKSTTPKQFVAAWRHVHDVFQDVGVSTVIWVWSPNVINPVPRVRLKPYYPGDGYVDWLGVVGYFAGTGPHTFTTLFDPTFRQIRTFSQKPFLLAETAAQPSPHKVAEIKDLLHQVAVRKDVVGFIWFDLNKETDWRINSDAASLRAFRTAVADPRLGFDVAALG